MKKKNKNTTNQKKKKNINDFAIKNRFAGKINFKTLQCLSSFVGAFFRNSICNLIKNSVDSSEMMEVHCKRHKVKFLV